MGWIILMWILTGIATAIPVILLLVQRLRFVQDFFALLLFAQFIVYLHIAPALWAPKIPEELLSLYVYLMLFCVLLFEVPFLVIYLRIKRAAGNPAVPPATVRAGRQELFAVATAIFAVVYLIIALRNGIFFARIGFEGLVEAILKLSLPEFVLYRMFQLTSVFLVSLLLASVVIQQPQARSRIVKASVLVAGGILVANQTVNSRVHSVIILAISCGILLMVGRFRLASRRGAGLAVIVTLIAAYAVQITLNARDIVPSQGFQVELFNPFHRGPEERAELDDARFRLNGIDLMARITPEARRQGFAMGEAWKGALMVAVGQLSFGTIVSAADIVDYKESFAGSPKRYLMMRYMDLNWPDYSSCALTDAYGNFGLWALPLTALVLGSLCALLTTGLSLHNSPPLLAFALFISFQLLIFEQELVVLLTALLNSLPVLIFVLLLNPIARASAKISNVHTRVGPPQAAISMH
jgi:hypothetical protein